MPAGYIKIPVCNQGKFCQYLILFDPGIQRGRLREIQNDGFFGNQAFLLFTPSLVKFSSLAKASRCLHHVYRFFFNQRPKLYHSFQKEENYTGPKRETLSPKRGNTNYTISLGMFLLTCSWRVQCWENFLKVQYQHKVRSYYAFC